MKTMRELSNSVVSHYYWGAGSSSGVQPKHVRVSLFLCVRKIIDLWAPPLGPQGSDQSPHGFIYTIFSRTDFSEPFFPLFFPAFLRSDISSFWSDIKVQSQKIASPICCFHVFGVCKHIFSISGRCGSTFCHFDPIFLKSAIFHVRLWDRTRLFSRFLGLYTFSFFWRSDVSH